MAAAPMLVEPDWLERELRAPHLRIVDATWYLASEGRDARGEYAAGHLPGAIYLDLGRDLADATSALRNTVAPAPALAEAFGAVGIGPEHRVIVYDRRGGYSAGRVWWVLRYLGHERTGILNGGFGRWQQEGRPVTQELPRFERVRFSSERQPRWLARHSDVERALAAGGAQIVDARSGERFRAGHIPGSINVPHAANLIGDPPLLRDRDELRALYDAAGVRFDRPVITTCGSGVTASFDAWALTWLGHPDVSVYDGSWDEWENLPDAPVATGS